MPRELTESDMFVLLSKRRRRLLVRVLQEATMPLPTLEVADRIGECEYENPTVNDRRTIYLALHHNHLPRLDEADVIVYDRDEDTVAPALNFDRLVRVLEEVDDRDRPWSGE